MRQILSLDMNFKSDKLKDYFTAHRADSSPDQ